jgi:membrane protein YqaA with SNARE-associated domain
MLRRLYDWTIALSARPSAVWALGVISFAESSIFPIPPDVILIPMSLARPHRAFFYAGLCTVTSVIGGLLGYAIGALLYDSLGKFLIDLYGYGDKVETFRAAYGHWGHWIILLKGLTPIPYKVVTITSGFAGYDLFWFTVLSIITRGARFYVLATLLYVWGEPARAFIEKRLGLAAFLFAVVFFGGIYAATFLF